MYYVLNIVLSGKMWARRRENKMGVSGAGYERTGKQDPAPRSNLVQHTSLSSLLPHPETLQRPGGRGLGQGISRGSYHDLSRWRDTYWPGFVKSLPPAGTKGATLPPPPPPPHHLLTKADLDNASHILKTDLPLGPLHKSRPKPTS